MKFQQRLNWERREQAIALTPAELSELIDPAFAGKEIEHFEIMRTGLANTNVFFKLKTLSQCFLLRLYMRDKTILKQEMALSARFGETIPMPEFIYFSENHPNYTYAIQKWVEGKPLFSIMDDLNAKELSLLASDLAHTLNKIAGFSLPLAGFFNEKLDVTPFEHSEFSHPFIDYIKDCLFQEYAGHWLGKSLSTRIWDFVIQNQDCFPSLDSPCLVHGDFNQDNIIIDEKILKVVSLVDWEFAYSGSYLFDIGTLMRFELPSAFEKVFIETYEKNRGEPLPLNWKKMVKVQDITNFVGLLNIKQERPNLIQDIKSLIEETLKL